MPEPDFNKTPAKKLTPEQKKYFSSMDTTASVFTESEIRAVRDGGDQALADVMTQQNADAIAALGSKSNADAQQNNVNQAEAFNRATPEDTSPNLRPPTRAQDTYSLNQAPAALMTSIPRQKFEYIATFRLTSQSLFEQLFSSSEVDNIDSEISSNENILQGMGGAPSVSKHVKAENEKLANKRTDVMNSIRRSLVFNVRSIDGPKVTFQYDTLNQYNRKRNVYRRVDYDPINIRFYDTFNNSAVKLWQYLYESTVKDGQNKSYGATNATEIMKKFNA